MLVAAIAVALSGFANAQSNVQVYGLLDVGIDHISHANPAGGGVTRVTSGGSNNSRFGFRGSEDLGNGLKAVFNLEGQLDVDLGASDGPLFRRQANVGLEGSFGKLILGRSYSTVYNFVNPFDPMGYAPAWSWVPTGNGTGSNKYSMTTAFDNMVKYEGRFGGFKVGASYGAGEVAGSEAEGRKMAAGVVYETGPISFVVTGERNNGIRNATGARTVSEAYHLGAAYSLTKDLSLKLGVRDLHLTTVRGIEARSNTWWGGANYQLTPVIGLTGAFYYQDVKTGVTPLDAAADPLMLVARAKYMLSKRTDLYATVARARAKNGAPVGLTRDASEDGGVTGFADHATGVMLGIQHRF
jgi:predicted porin